MRPTQLKLLGIAVIAAGGGVLLVEPAAARAMPTSCDTIGECVSECPSEEEVIDWCADEAIAHGCMLTGGGCNNWEGNCSIAYKHCHMKEAE